ncbi:zinc-ribbon domain-containing protein [uncultured Aquimarina sp.]|uniref:zinc-ribbon domain-containing protein n=1 Tax=uncultured Aquimarina sp. TaxID=575652 RepID=UPI00262CCFB3|nr:zinc-ribbon domain-containing protein [uncultured Aquimarina sp.]
MIIYGSKAVHIKSEQSKKSICISCGTQGSLTLSVFRRHAHIFWIPLFPIGKKGMSQCQHCKNVLKTKEMPEPIRKEYDILKNKAKGPIWQFTGLGILVVLIAWGSYVNGQDKKLETEYIVSPMDGDIYEYKIETNSYSTLKVTSVSKDSVFVSPNEYEISKKSRIYKINKSENYSEFSYGISKARLKEMYESGEIFDINR